jgi:hypothetical protein
MTSDRVWVAIKLLLSWVLLGNGKAIHLGIPLLSGKPSDLNADDQNSIDLSSEQLLVPPHWANAILPSLRTGVN